MSTKLSLGEALAKGVQNQPLNKKINKIGKMISNKFFGTKKENESEVSDENKLPNIKPASLGPSPSTKYFLSQEETLKNVSSSKNNNKSVSIPISNGQKNTEIANANSNCILVDIENPVIDTKSIKSQEIQINNELQTVSGLSTLFNNLQHNLIPITASFTNNKCYSPILSQKQYTNRLEKLNDINNLIIGQSETQFLFI